MSEGPYRKESRLCVIGLDEKIVVASDSDDERGAELFVSSLNRAHADGVAEGAKACADLIDWAKAEFDRARLAAMGGKAVTCSCSSGFCGHHAPLELILTKLEAKR